MVLHNSSSPAIVDNLLKEINQMKLLFTYYLRTVHTITKLVAQILFTLLLRIRLLCYLGTSGLTQLRYTA